jgi:hypothetical protein
VSDGGDATQTASASAGTATATAGTATATATDASASATVADTGIDVTTDACGDDDDEDTGVIFDHGPTPECDLFEQDCLDGEKCIPRGFFSTECVPIPKEPLEEGEACTAVSREDPCDVGQWCGPTATGVGESTCVRLCAGTFVDPVCPPDMICVFDDDNVVAYCAPPCDPFEPDACGEGLSCLPTRLGLGCVQGGYAGGSDHCYQHDSCVGGLACHEVAGCCHSKCCAPFCDGAHPCEVGDCVPLDPPIPGPEGLGLCG